MFALKAGQPNLGEVGQMNRPVIIGDFKRINSFAILQCVKNHICSYSCALSLCGRNDLYNAKFRHDLKHDTG